MPTQRQLQIFCEAAADCKFRDTADRLGMSQPAISSHIAALERGIGHSLFTRRRGTTPLLSADGRRLLQIARRTLELSRELSSGFGGKMAKQRARVGIRHYLLETVVRSAIPRFFDTHPDIDLDLRVVDDVDEMGRLIQSGALDVALFRGDPPIDPTLLARTSCPAGCSIYAAPALAGQLATATMSLSRAPFILLPETGRRRDWIGVRLAEVGIRPENVVLRSQFPDIIREWVLEGRGIGVLFDRTAAACAGAGLLTRIGPPLRPASTLFLAAARPSPALVKVMDFLEQLLDSAPLSTS